MAFTYNRENKKLEELQDEAERAFANELQMQSNHLTEMSTLLGSAYSALSTIRRETGVPGQYPAEITEVTRLEVERWIADADDLIARISHARDARAKGES